MNIRVTPLGFVSGDIEVHSHCMFVYSKRDESFVRSVADFLMAGLNAGEISACIIDDPVRSLLNDLLTQWGVDTQSPEGQIRLCGSQGLLFRHGVFDSQFLVDHWTRELLPCLDKWAGVRVFCDTAPFCRNRLSRLKLLEWEALINLNCPVTISLCGYQAGAAGRSLLAQAKSVHPFIANSRSIRRNPAFMSTARFLSGFYRFRRVSKEYAARAEEERAVRHDLEEVAARTPLTMSQIRELSIAVGGIFTHMVEKGGGKCSCKCESHMHVTLAAESDKLIVTIRDHALGVTPVGSSLHEHASGSASLSEGLVDDLIVDSWKGEAVATVIKRYHAPCTIECEPPSNEL
jgi:hypothetical protein